MQFIFFWIKNGNVSIHPFHVNWLGLGVLMMVAF